MNKTKRARSKKSNKKVDNTSKDPSQPCCSGITIEKRTRNNTKIKIFELTSSGGTSPDPYATDGSGSDEDYDPVGNQKDLHDWSSENCSSDETRPDYSENENYSEDQEESDMSDESIFDTHKNKRKCNSSMSAKSQHKKKKVTDDEDADTMSINSSTLINNIGDVSSISSFLTPSLPARMNSDSCEGSQHREVPLLSMMPANLVAPKDVPCGEAPTSPPNQDFKDPEGNSHREVPPSPQNPDSVDPECNPYGVSSPSSQNLDPEGNPHIIVPLLPQNPDPKHSEDNSHNETPLSPQNIDPEYSNGKPYLMMPLSQQIPNPKDSESNSYCGIPFSPQTCDSEDLERPPSPRILVPASPESILHREAPSSPKTVIFANSESSPRREAPSQISDSASPEGDLLVEASPQQEESAWEETIAEIPFFEFDENSAGVQFEIGPNSSVEQVFGKLLPPNILDYIVEKTNAYGQALCSKRRPTRKNNYNFRDTNRQEMLKFLGLCLLMGQVNVPQKRKLFTRSDPLYYHPIFQYSMSGRRFEQLLKCVYVAELNSKGKEKITQFINTLSRHFQECYKPSRELSLDESLLLFRGRVTFRQYIKNKKAKYGIKFYELTSDDGYMLNIAMYTGKDTDSETIRGKKTEKIVMTLMQPYLLKGHWLFMDNYYNSVELSQKLLNLKTHTTGTLRANRKSNPKELIKKKLKKNEYVWVRKNKVYVSKWVDKRPVLMINTASHPKLVTVSNRYGKTRTKPEEVSLYNMHMSGIDRADQMVSYYSSPRKTIKWYKKVFFHLLDLTVWNSFFLYRKYCQNKCDFLSYREELIKNLINVPSTTKIEQIMSQLNKNDNRQQERREFILPPITNSHGNDGHWPEKIPVREGSKKTSNYMKCRMCTKKKIRRETGLRCKGCEEKPPLCALCFEEWHNQ